MSGTTFAIPEFVPHPLLKNPHLQTLAGAYLPGRLPRYTAKRHEVEVSHGDKIIIHDDCPADWATGRATCVLVHGLGGCHGSPYLVRIAGRLNQHGIRTFRVDLRGCGHGRELARRPFNAGQSHDIAAVVERVERLCPQSAIVLAGFSLGGNIVLKLIAEIGCQSSPVSSAVAVSPPIALGDCCRHICTRPNRLYNWSFMKRLLSIHRERARAGLPDPPLKPRPRNIYEFDDCFTGPCGGFRDAEDYYEQSSAGPQLSRIAKPTLLLTSRDDPLIPFNIFDKYALASDVQFYAAQAGGHLGFVGRRDGDPDGRWMDWRVVSWVARFS